MLQNLFERNIYLLMEKKIFIFFIFCYLLLFQSKNTLALWFKYENNPIIPKNVDKKDQIKAARAPSILIEDNVIKMWFMNIYQGKWVLDFIYSYNGIDWIKPYNDPVLVPNNDEDHIAHPTIIKENNIYKLWYSTLLYNDNKYHIKYATSTDGIQWNVSPIPHLSGQFNWEINGVENPYVLKKDNLYLMWYGAWGSNFQISLATSYDGINWFKKGSPIYLENNILHADNHNLKIINNLFHLWYLTGNGTREEIYHYISEDAFHWQCSEKSCLVLKKDNVNFPNEILNDSDTIIYNNNIYLYYSGIHDGTWQIGLATEFPINLTPTPSPTPTAQPPIVIIPGLFGSWNKEAILHNQKVNYNQWKIPSFIHEYQGLIDTLKNLGYQQNKDFYLFAYDWRQPIEKTIDDLNNFLDQLTINNQQFHLIGHSLGGLIARIFTQKYPQKIAKIISVGSPHQGAVQVYKPLSAGEIDRENTFMWLAQKLILVLNKTTLETDRETLQKKIPVAFDLLPIFAFLKDESGQLISTQSMILKNPTLPKFNFSFPQIYHQFTSLYATNIETPEYYTTQPPTVFDNLLGNYQDGRPVSLLKGSGDGTVLTKSAFEINDNDSLVFNNFNHGEIIYKKEVIKKILDTLNLNYDENNISEGKRTVISPSLIFLIRSPATMEVVAPDNNHYFEEEGIIFIENATTGNYQLLVKGKEKGSYQIIVGQIAANNDLWETIDGSIETDQPENEVDRYQINFNSDYASSQFPTPTPSPTPAFISSNSSNQSSSTNSNQQNGSNQSFNPNNANFTPTPTPRLLSINRSLPEENLTDKQLKVEENKNVLGEKTKNARKQKKLNLNLLFTIIIFLILSFVVYYKKEKVLSLLQRLKYKLLKGKVAGEGFEPPTSSM